MATSDAPSLPFRSYPVKRLEEVSKPPLTLKSFSGVKGSILKILNVFRILKHSLRRPVLSEL